MFEIVVKAVVAVLTLYISFKVTANIRAVVAFSSSVLERYVHAVHWQKWLCIGITCSTIFLVSILYLHLDLSVECLMLVASIIYTILTMLKLYRFWFNDGLAVQPFVFHGIAAAHMLAISSNLLVVLFVLIGPTGLLSIYGG